MKLSKVFFDTKSLYYLPQYLPVYRELIKKGIDIGFVFYEGPHDAIIEKIIVEEGLKSYWVKDESSALEIYREVSPDWVFFGNTFQFLDELHSFSKSAQLGHGIGPKASYYTKSSHSMSVRFVEGEYRTNRLKEMYPKDVFIDVGFCKLDPIVNGELDGDDLLQVFGLDPSRKTILYAPTFYPSSIEKFPVDWPSEFSEYNIIIKPHYFSYSKKKYKSHMKRLSKWSSFENVYVADVKDYNLLPFFCCSDVLISDASSALFEFALLDKPVIWCDFLKLRWSYRGPFKYKFKRRMDKDYGVYADVAVHAASYKELRSLVAQEINDPSRMSAIRKELSDKLAGVVDGAASARIVDYLYSKCD